MSQENVDRFIASTEAFNRRDLEAWLSAYDPEAVIEPQAAAFEGSSSGHEGLREFYAGLCESFDQIEVRYPDIRDLGDRVLALGTIHVVGAESQVETEAPVAIIATYRDGLCVHWKDFGDHAQALEAAALSQ